MFRLNNIILNYKDGNINPTIYSFEEVTYIYGTNNVGKTIMVQAIDYVLGKSEFDFENKEGLDNIESIEAKITVENEVIFLKRTYNNIFSYKRSEIDEYIITNEESYKDNLTNLISKGDKKYLEVFYNYTKENVSCRAFSFFNFIDEKGLGNISNVFTRAKDYQHQIRARNLMSFIFNFENIKKISELMKEEEMITNEIDKLKDEVSNYNYFLSLIQKEIHNLNLSNDLDIKELEKNFIKYKSNFFRDKENIKKSSGDLGYLVKVSYTLSENLKYQNYLRTQVDKLSSQNKNAMNLLSSFKLIAEKDDEYRQYINKISKLIDTVISDNDTLRVIDYDKRINELQNKKDKIDKEIELISNGLKQNKYEEAIKQIGVIEEAFNKIKQFKSIETFEKKAQKLKLVKNEITELNKKFSNTLKDKFDNNLLKIYKKLDGKPAFVTEDFNKTSFGIDFNPIKSSLSGIRAINKDEPGKLFVYNPGSMARETTWQILSYLVMFDILLEHFKELPFMRLLVIDGMYQPFDDNKDSYPSVYQLVQEEAKKLGIQLIVVSTKNGLGEPVCADYQIDLSSGFNKAHKN